MLKKLLSALLIFCLLPLIPSEIAQAEEAVWQFGFSAQEIIPAKNSEYPLYIAGYNQGVEVSGVLDYCQARAVCIGVGEKKLLLIGVDAIALDSGTVSGIRNALSDLTFLSAVHVYATHTHAGADTLGLWGPIGVNGKNPEYMAALIDACEAAGREAASSLTDAHLYYGSVQTDNMYRDSRYPIVTDENLYCLRFAPTNGESGLRMYFYGAHAESLRGSNTLLSRDFPGLLVDSIKAETGDDGMFLPGAIGGLIMTREFVSIPVKGAVENLRVTGEKLTEYALRITPDTERRLSPSLQFSTVSFTSPLDNPVFVMYRFLGILTNNSKPGKGQTGYDVVSEVSAIRLDDLVLFLLPGECFPELISGEQFGDTNPDGQNPKCLREICNANGVEDFLIVGLANDELGYIVPPSDYLLNPDMPYLERITDKRGEDHYEETNSIGISAAEDILIAAEEALLALK